MNKGKLIVIEGSDGTGKETQSGILLNRLNSSGVLGKQRAHLVSFPDYDSPAGKKIRAYLNGELGNLEEISPRNAALLYAEDRRAKKREMEDILRRGDWIVADRYIQSNMAYQGAKIENSAAREDFYRWLNDLEYGIFGIPKPDLVIMLKLESFVAAEHLAAREQFDIHEQDEAYLDRVRSEYEKLASGYYKDIFSESWKTVLCTKDRKQLSRESISDEIYKIIQEIF